MYKHIIIVIFFLISFDIAAQGIYNVEKIWGIQFKLPKDCVGSAGGSKAHYWVDTRKQEGFDFELTLHKTTPKLLDKKLVSVLESIPLEIINQEQKERLSQSDTWTHTLRNHIEVSSVEIQNKYWVVFFSFEWEKNAYVGWMCVRDKQWKAISQTVFQSIQPAS